YVGEPYEKEVRYSIILESIALETFDGDRAPTDGKKDEDPCLMEEDETVLEEEHKRRAIEKINEIHARHHFEDVPADVPTDVCSRGTMTPKMNH
ncbi:6457_t:CDS:1, partial [Cetraspora pellucida]